MTATSVTSLSLNPPSMLVCVNKEASIHKILDKGSSFCINVLSNSQKNNLLKFAVTVTRENQDSKIIHGRKKIILFSTRIHDLIFYVNA